MIPSTTERVALNTSENVNDSISERTREEVARYAAATPQVLDQRLRQLDGEWDVERVTSALVGLGLLAGVLLTATLGEVWLVLVAVLAGCLLLHGVTGWTPLLPLLRRAGSRTSREINCERYALKALRGDFHPLARVTTPQDREDLSRFEGEGGAVAPTPAPDASAAEVVEDAIRAAKCGPTTMSQP
jgi:hypothetical protein